MPKRNPNELPVARLLRADGWMQSEIAERVGCSQPTISDFLSGKQHRSEAIEKVLRKLYSDYTDRELFGEDRT